MYSLTHRPITHSGASARSPSPSRPSLTRARPGGFSLSNVRHLVLSHRLLRPLLFLLCLLLIALGLHVGESIGDYPDAAGGGEARRWIPIPNVIVHPHFPGSRTVALKAAQNRAPTISDISPAQNALADDNVDPIPANPLALLEEDRQAAYEIYGDSSVDELLEDLYNPKPVLSAPKSKGLFGFSSKNAKVPVDQAQLEEHTYLQNGLLLVNPRGRHPIYDLIEKAEVAWEAKLERQSTTLDQAVAEYRTRWGRYPPRGFDKWWAYVQKHAVPLPDEYDEIMRDLSPYFAYSPADMRTLQQVQRDREHSYTIASVPAGPEGGPGRIELAVGRVGEGKLGKDRIRLQLELMRGYDVEQLNQTTVVQGENATAADGADTEDGQAASLLAQVIEEARQEVEQVIVDATGAWEATFSAHDGPSDMWDWEFGELMRETIEEGSFLSLTTKPRMDYLGWPAGCPMSAPLRSSPLSGPPPPLPNAPSAAKYLIHSHRASMSPCAHPSLVHHIGMLSAYGHGKGPGPQDQRRVLFSLCKTELHGDFTMVPAERWAEVADDPTPWGAKDPRLVWRGSTTGISMNPDQPWRESQRVRLMSLVAATNGSHPVLPPFSPAHPVGQPMQLQAAWLNPVLTDIAFVKGPIQCERGTCEELRAMFEWRSQMEGDELWKYKYLLDVDGNGWSARFKHLVSANSVVFKSTIFPEWYTDRIQPWVHYVPIQVDLSDLYDVLTFFRGDVSRGGKGAHDELAEKIARQGRGWSRAYWRKEDMVAYTFRLFLEYGRLMSDERAEMDYRPAPN